MASTGTNHKLCKIVSNKRYDDSSELSLQRLLVQFFGTRLPQASFDTTGSFKFV